MKYILITLICVLLSVNVVFAQSYAYSSASASAQDGSASSFASSTSYVSINSTPNLTTTTSTSGNTQAQATAQVQSGSTVTIRSSDSNPTRTIIKTYKTTNEINNNNLTKDSSVATIPNPPQNIQYIKLVPTKNESDNSPKSGNKDYQKSGTKIAQLIPLDKHSDKTIKKQSQQIDKVTRTNEFLVIGFLGLSLILLILIISLIVSNKKNKSKKYF